MKREIECPECGSTKIRKYGFLLTRQGKTQRFQCLTCARTFIANNIEVKT